MFSVHLRAKCPETKDDKEQKINKHTPDLVHTHRRDNKRHNLSTYNLYRASKQSIEVKKTVK